MCILKRLLFLMLVFYYPFCFAECLMKHDVPVCYKNKMVVIPNPLITRDNSPYYEYNTAVYDPYYAFFYNDDKVFSYVDVDMDPYGR